MPRKYHTTDENGKDVPMHGICKQGPTTYHCINGYLHREDGPAFINKYENLEIWALNGIQFIPDKMPNSLFIEYCKWQENKKKEKKRKLKYESKLTEIAGGYYWRNSKKQLHRLDGPALQTKGFLPREEWYRDGRLHREDGPAITRTYNNWKISPDNVSIDEEWWFDGIQYGSKINNLKPMSDAPYKLQKAYAEWEENKKNKNA